MRISDAELKRLLLASNKVKPTELKDAETVHEQTGDALIDVVIKRKLMSESALLKLYAKSIDVPFVELKDRKIPHDVLTKIPERTARKYEAIVFGKEGSQYQLAMADPEDFQAADFLAKQIGSDIKINLAASADIDGAIDQYKGSISTEISKAIKDSSAEEAPEKEVSEKDLAEDAPISKTVNVILEYAIKSEASDIHLEPRESQVQVRFRVDGVLRETMTLPKSILPAVVSRIKILSNLKIDEHRLPQDGRFKFSVGARTVALRVSTLPIMDGEKVVMRILDESSQALTLEELGFEGHGLEIIVRNLHKPHGMTLVTGPTGSGKSTTLYSVLNLLNTPGVNISTVEDPVEYRVSGVNQTQVNPKAGMTFASGLRALLRQDPNIIMVGEIRDSETADLAVQAALTGHVVLSTLHTNNAATALPRLLDMNVEPFLIASTVNTIIGQRLVRRLCPVCRIPYVPSPTEVSDLKKDFAVDATLKLFRGADPAVSSEHHDKHIEPTGNLKAKNSILEKIAADPNIINRSAASAAAKAATKPEEKPAELTGAKTPELHAGEFLIYKASPEGCPECSQTGYHGRMGIYESLEVDEATQKLIVTHATSEEIQDHAVKNGMITMQQDGFLKVLRGLTSVEEVLRVTRE